jgi:seryl-tRNA synthetase
MADDLNKYLKDNKLRTPGELIVNNKKYVFAMNTKKKCRVDVQKAAKLNGYSILFIDNASNMYADPLPEYCSVYMLKSDYVQKCSMDRLINTITAIAEKYKELLKEKGYDIENVPLTKIYLGCERYENIPIKPSCNK